MKLKKTKSKVFDSAYFRYVMASSKVDTLYLANLLEVSRNHMDKKIKKGIFDIDEARILMDLFELQFNEIFKFKGE